MRNDFETNYLAHWGIKKGGKKENHKYYQRVEKNGKYLYFYTQAEYEAWLHRGQKKVDQAGKTAKAKVNGLADRFKKSNLLDSIRKGQTKAYDLANRARTALTKANVQSVIDKGEKTVNNFLEKNAKTVNKIKDTAEKVQKKVENKIVNEKNAKKSEQIADFLDKTFNKSSAKKFNDYALKGAEKVNKIVNSSKAKSVKMGSSSQKSYEKKGTNIIQKAVKTIKDIWDYDITGKGYTRDAWNDKSAHEAQSEYFKNPTSENLQKWHYAVSESERKWKNAKQNEKNALIPKLKQAVEDFQENTAYTISKGERKIADLLRKSKDSAINALEKNANERDHYYSFDSSLGAAYNKNGKVGSSIIATILASAAAAVVVTAATAAIKKFGPAIVEKTKEIIDKIFPKPTVNEERDLNRQEESKTQEKPPKDFSSDCPSSYKEDRASHSDIPQKSEPTTRDEDMAKINPNYYELTDEDYRKAQEAVAEYQWALMSGDQEAIDRAYEKYLEVYAQYEGYMQNCANCTLTYDMRRRGYDVDASWNPQGTDIEAIFDWYDMDISKDVLAYQTNNVRKGVSKSECKAIENELKKTYPEGSYGHFLLYWTDGNGDGYSDGGHDVVWSIENGEVVLRDCQNNQKIELYEYAKDACAFELFRADDKPLKENAYSVCVADKATDKGVPDKDNDFDDSYNDFYLTNEGKVYDYQDDAYDYRKNKQAAGKKRKK